MPKRDYYDILGVSRTATAEEIKAAYRKLARQYHPDVSKAPDAEKRFAEVQEAYGILSDAKKRKLYDQHGHSGPAVTGEWSGGQGGFNVDLDDLGSMFDTFFGSGGQGGGRGRQTNPGGFRSGQQPRGPGAPRRPRAAPPVEVELSISFMTAAKGGKERVRLTVAGRETSLEVQVPPAVEPGTKLRVKGVEGRVVLLRVKVGGHPVFRRGDGEEFGRGLDLYLDLPLTLAEATLGATVGVPTLDGSVELVVQPGSPSGRKLRVKGKGLSDRTGRAGDLYAVVKIVPPEAGTRSEAERKTLEAIARHTPDLRSGPPWPATPGTADDHTD